MTCPLCGGKTHITDSRSDGETVRRRRECLECKHRFTTKEVDIDMLERLLKTMESQIKIVEKTRDFIQDQLAQIKNLIEQAQAVTS